MGEQMGEIADTDAKRAWLRRAIVSAPCPPIEWPIILWRAPSAGSSEDRSKPGPLNCPTAPRAFGGAFLLTAIKARCALSYIMQRGLGTRASTNSTASSFGLGGGGPVTALRDRGHCVHPPRSTP